MPSTVINSLISADLILLMLLNFVRRRFFKISPIPLIESNLDREIFFLFLFLCARIANLCDSSLILCKKNKVGSFFWKKGDIGTIDRFGPDGISKLIKTISNKAGRFQTGYIYDYAFVMLIGLSILLTYLILN